MLVVVKMNLARMENAKVSAALIANVAKEKIALATKVNANAHVISASVAKSASIALNTSDQLSLNFINLKFVYQGISQRLS